MLQFVRVFLKQDLDFFYIILVILSLFPPIKIDSQERPVFGGQFS